MLAYLRSLVSSLKFAELRTLGVLSWDVEAGAEFPTLRVKRIEVHNAVLQTTLGSIRAASVELSNVAVRLPVSHSAEGAPQRLPGVTIEELRLKDVSLAPVAVPRRAADLAPQRWRLDPLGQLDGTLHADIVDAAWIFDADVTIPISGGRIDFNRASVEHIGPDSSMGVSRMGVYVDAPNGRTYLFLLSATHVPGAHFERRGGSLLPGWSGDRGSIELQPLLECLLSGMPLGTLATGTRDMASRARVRGEFRLGDGILGNQRHRVVLAGRASGKNHVGLSSAASGRGTVLRIPELWAAESHWESSGAVVSTGKLSATLSVELDAAASTPAVLVSIADLTLHEISVNRCSPQPTVPLSRPKRPDSRAT
jgi:hypothetical protein